MKYTLNVNHRCILQESCFYFIIRKFGHSFENRYYHMAFLSGNLDSAIIPH